MIPSDGVVTEMAPLVSVCIPNYNYARYIDECVGSVLAQTCPDIEIIFVDNRSDDSSLEQIAKYSGRVRIFVNDTNIGMVGNFNRCSEHASGKYLVFLSTDDSLLPDFVKRSVEVMEAHEDVGIVICEREEMGADGQPLEPIPFFYNRSCIVPSQAQLPVMMMSGIGVPCQVLVRRSVFEATGRYSPRFSHAFDWHSNFKCVLHSNLAYIHERLARYRVFPGSSTAAMTRNLGMAMEHYLLLLEFRELARQHGFSGAVQRYPEALEKLAMMCLRYSVAMIAAKECETAKKYLHLALAYWLGVSSNPLFIAIRKHLDGEVGASEFERELKRIPGSGGRQKSYPPPEGYLDLEVGDKSGVYLP